MIVTDFSWKAILSGAATVIGVGLIFSLLQPVYFFAVFDVEQFNNVSFDADVEAWDWPGFAYLLLSTSVAYGAGGYIAGKVAGCKPIVHALCAISVPVAVMWSIPGEPRIEIVGAIIATLVSCFAAVGLSMIGSARGAVKGAA